MGGVCETDCDTRVPGGCREVCQNIANEFDVIVGVTWGSASEDVQAYWKLKCDLPGSFHAPPLPQICKKWDCSCHAARFHTKFKDHDDVIEWADEFCRTLPLDRLL